jgi:hypothetical protein
VARFFDKNNGMWVELFTSKIPELPKAAISRARAWQSKDASGQEVKEESNGTHHIRRNHLKGHARQLSEGAIHKIKTFLEDDDDLPSKRVEKVVKVIKKCPSAKW